MTTIVYKKTEIAVKQLETAIDLFLNHKDYICAITLAGASEEILGKFVEQMGKKSAHKSSAESLKAKFNLTISNKELNSRYLNFARNTLKHANITDGDTVKLDAQTEAISLIIRTIDNLIKLDNSFSFNTPDFFYLLDNNRRDLLFNT